MAPSVFRSAVLVGLLGLLVAALPAVVPTPGIPRGPPPQRKPPCRVRWGWVGQWRLIFWDGFAGSRLKTDNWQPNWLGRSDTTVTKPVNTDGTLLL